MSLSPSAACVSKANWVFVVARPDKASAPHGNGMARDIPYGKPPSPLIRNSRIADGQSMNLSPMMEEQSKQILNNALERYRRADGYEGHLMEAAWQLEQMGRDAWPVLSGVAFAHVPECEFFLGAMIRVGGVSWRDRRRALLAAARNPSANTRNRLFELLDELPAKMRMDLLHELVSPELTEGDLKDRAREALGALDAQET